MDPEGAKKAVLAARANKRKNGGRFKGLSREQILVQIKKSRYEIFEERFGVCN